MIENYYPLQNLFAFGQFSYFPKLPYGVQEKYSVVYFATNFVAQNTSKINLGDVKNSKNFIFRLKMQWIPMKMVKIRSTCTRVRHFCHNTIKICSCVLKYHVTLVVAIWTPRIPTLLQPIWKFKTIQQHKLFILFQFILYLNGGINLKNVFFVFYKK